MRLTCNDIWMPNMVSHKSISKETWNKPISYGKENAQSPFICHSVLLIVQLLSSIWGMCPAHFHVVLVSYWTMSVTLVLCLMMVLQILSFSFTDLLQWKVVLLVGCLTSQQQASVSQGRICSDNFTCCHTEIEIADQTFYLTQSQYTDTGPTSPSADPITPGAWQGSHWSANF